MPLDLRLRHRKRPFGFPRSDKQEAHIRTHFVHLGCRFEQRRNTLLPSHPRHGDHDFGITEPKLLAKLSWRRS